MRHGKLLRLCLVALTATMAVVAATTANAAPANITPTQSVNPCFATLTTAAGSAAKSPRPKELPVDDLAASFQAAAIDVLAEKTAQAAEKFKARGILIAGGVSANRLLRSEIEDRAGKVPVYSPPQALCTDNAAMIAAAAHQRLAAGHADDLAMDVLPTWPLAI